MTTTATTTVLTLAARGPIRARDLDASGVARTTLRRLCDSGLLERVGRGLYQLTDFPATELHTLAEVAKRVPHGTICLLSALQLHGLGTEAPHAVWLLIDSHARTPRLDRPRLEVVRASGSARDHGVEVRVIEGVPVRVTSAAKTVADCFRYRRHVGLDVALDALRDYLRHARTTLGAGSGDGSSGSRAAPDNNRIGALIDAAKADHIYSVLRPYLEALA
jgi:predicted transcriptional regulator of viral defense system